MTTTGRLKSYQNRYDKWDKHKKKETEDDKQSFKYKHEEENTFEFTNQDKIYLISILLVEKSLRPCYSLFFALFDNVTR